MKRCVLAFLLLASATVAFADGGNYGVGLMGSIYNQTFSMKGKSDYTASSLSLQVFGSIALSPSSELDPVVLFGLNSEKDPSGVYRTAGTDTASGSFGLGLGYYMTVATAGPLNVKLGANAKAVSYGSPKGWSGSYTHYSGTIGTPVIVDVTIAPAWSIRIYQPVLEANAESYDTAGSTWTFSSLQFNSFNPSVGAAFHF